MAKFKLKVAPTPTMTRRETPVRTGSQMDTSYIMGHNPRRTNLTSEEGVHGVPVFGVKRSNRRSMGMTSGTAPQKHEMEHFGTGGFGDTGLTGES